MSFTYDFNTYPLGSQVRLLIADTDVLNPIFSDDEINQFLFMSSSSGIYTSSQFFPTSFGGGYQGAPVYSVYRAAALALDTLGSLKARLAGVLKVLDVSVDLGKAAAALKAQAKDYRDLAAQDGSFAISEQVFDSFSARERVWKQFLRIYSSS